MYETQAHALTHAKVMNQASLCIQFTGQSDSAHPDKMPLMTIVSLLMSSLAVLGGIAILLRKQLAIVKIDSDWRTFGI